MGRDKLLLEVAGEPLLRRVCEALGKRCSEVVVVGKAGAGAAPEGVRRVLEERPGRLGPLAGIEAGLVAARERLAFVAAGDLPFLPADLVGFLLKVLCEEDAAAVVPRHGGRAHPLCAAYDRRLLPLIGTSLDEGVRSVREFLDDLGTVRYVESELERFGRPERFLTNINRPEDLALAWRSSEDTRP